MSRDVSFSVSSLPTDSLLGRVISLQQGFNLGWPKVYTCICTLSIVKNALLLASLPWH